MEKVDKNWRPLLLKLLRIEWIYTRSIVGRFDWYKFRKLIILPGKTERENNFSFLLSCFWIVAWEKEKKRKEKFEVMFRFLLRFLHKLSLPEFFHLIFFSRRTDTPFPSFCQRSCFFHSRLSRSFLSSSRNWKLERAPFPFLPPLFLSFEIQKPTFLLFSNISQLSPVGFYYYS